MAKKMFCNNDICVQNTHCFRFLKISTSSDLYCPKSAKNDKCANHIEWSQHDITYNKKEK